MRWAPETVNLSQRADYVRANSEIGFTVIVNLALEEGTGVVWPNAIVGRQTTRKKSGKAGGMGGRGKVYGKKIETS